MKTTPPPSTLLAEDAWVDVDRGSTLLVPVGSFEQHGPHLPLDTDTVIATAAADAIAAALAAQGHKILVAPALCFGASGEHQSFAGTLSIGHEAVETVIVELTRSASTWAGRIVYVNGHGGNVPTLKVAVNRLRNEQHSVTWVACAFEGATDAHAGHDETSVMLHLAPERVRTERIAPGNTTPLSELMPQLVAGGIASVSDSGVLGDPSTATADAGRLLFETMVLQLVDSVAAEPAPSQIPTPID